MERVSLALSDCSTPFSSRHQAIGFAFLCKVSQSLRLTKHRPSYLRRFLMAGFPFVYEPQRKWVFHAKIMVNCLVCRFVGQAFLGIEKRKPDGDGTPRNKKNVVLQELTRNKKSSSPLALEVDKFKNNAAYGSSKLKSAQVLLRCSSQEVRERHCLRCSLV